MLLVLHISAWNSNIAVESSSEPSPLQAEARAHRNLHAHVCLFIFACNRVQHSIQSFPEHWRNVTVILGQKLPDFEACPLDSSDLSLWLASPALPMTVGTAQLSENKLIKSSSIAKISALLNASPKCWLSLWKKRREGWERVKSQWPWWGKRNTELLEGRKVHPETLEWGRTWRWW